MAKKKAEPTEESKEIKFQEEIDEDSVEKPGVYAKVDKDARVIIDKYKKHGIKVSTLIEDAIDLYDLYHSLPNEIRAVMDHYAPKEVEIEGLNPEYAKHFEVIKTGLKLLEKQEHIDSEVEEERDLWVRARAEMKMMLIGKTTFNQLIMAASEAPRSSQERPFKSNLALAIINWITGKAIKALDLEEILEAIKKMWVVANYFYIIEVQKEEEDSDKYLITFKHRQRLAYSNYWLGYFSELFTSDAFSFGCMVVDSEAFDEFFTLTIKRIYDKHDLEFDLNELNLEESINSIKELYVKAKLFTKIDYLKEKEGFRLTLKHSKSKRYSNYWLENFTRLFKSEGLTFMYLVEGETLEDTLSLTIKKGYKKEITKTDEI